MIDTGFIVFNDRTYPNFKKLLAEIGQEFQDSEMSFSVRNTGSGMEYNGHDLNTLFAQRRNIFSPKFYGLVSEIVRFNKLAHKFYEEKNESTSQQLQTLGDCLDQHDFSERFRTHYILPMVAAIWSCSMNDATAFPLKFFLQFFFHHGLINIVDRPQWHVLKGGSSSYIPALTEPFISRLHLNTPIQSIKRDATKKTGGVEITHKNGTDTFDKVIIACHSDQAIKLLSDPNEQESSILGRMKYSPNDVVLHSDDSIMPKRKLAWASWNFRLDDVEQQLNSPALVSYYMNRLQGLPENKTDNTPDFFVTLNGSQYIDDSKVHQRFEYDHPVMDADMISAQQERKLVHGQQHTYFAGAYWYNGFHEDGVRSAVDVVKSLGVDWGESAGSDSLPTLSETDSVNTSSDTKAA
jgi:predicted NAD/FAD-binding protein